MAFADPDPYRNAPHRRKVQLPGSGEFPEWMLDANCAGTDPELFFPEKGGSTREAKSICSRCTVQAECLDYGLELNDRFGIFGGLAPRQRAAFKASSDAAIHTQQETA